MRRAIYCTAIYCTAIVLAAVAPIHAWSQTYDTPDNLAVSLSHPVYMYVDQYGYVHITGMVHNESTVSSVGNVLIHVQYHDTLGSDPAYAETVRASLDVLPPGSHSPFVATALAPNSTISSATATLLGFAPANPKHVGLDMAPDPRYPDPTRIILSDASGINHTGVTVHAAYHDTFDPPRMLRVYTTHVGDVGAGQSTPYTIPERPPQGAKGFMVFAESDSFSSVMYRETLDDTRGDTTGYGARITDVYAPGGSDDAVPDDTIRVSVTVPDGSGAELWLYVMVKRSDTMAAVWLERVPVSAAGTVSVPWEPLSPGRYVAETYLWDGANVPVAEPGPPVAFRVE